MNLRKEMKEDESRAGGVMRYLNLRPLVPNQIQHVMEIC